MELLFRGLFALCNVLDRRPTTAYHHLETYICIYVCTNPNVGFIYIYYIHIHNVYIKYIYGKNIYVINIHT